MNNLIQHLKSQSISAGILAANWLEFPDILKILAKNQIHLLHFDIADGHFSSLFTTGSIALKHFPKPFIKDVHLMVNSPFETVKNCVNAGANIITLQVEENENLSEIYQWLKTHNVLCGISICPNTPLSSIIPYLEDVELIQILTLDPRTGIKTDEKLLFQRINQLLSTLGEKRINKFISIDGSITIELAEKLSKFDIDWIVSGSNLFKGDSLEKNLKQWKDLIS